MKIPSISATFPRILENLVNVGEQELLNGYPSGAHGETLDSTHLPRSLGLVLASSKLASL